MENILYFLIVCLAVWRISSLINGEAGPFDMFTKLREKAGVRTLTELMEIDVVEEDDGGLLMSTIEEYPIYEVPLPSKLQPTLLAEMVVCLWCTSLWIAFGFLFIGLIAGVEITAVIASPFALSAGAIGYDRLIG